jgi:hypothetical protein
VAPGVAGEVAPKEGRAEVQAKTEPAGKAASDEKKGKKPEAAVPKTTLPPTMNVIVEPHEEGPAVFVVDSGFVSRLRGDLEKLLEKK